MNPVIYIVWDEKTYKLEITDKMTSSRIASSMEWWIDYMRDTNVPVPFPVRLADQYGKQYQIGLQGREVWYVLTGRF